MIPVESVTVELYEGPPYHTNRPRVEKTLWDATRVLNRWRIVVAKPGGGYWKAGFLVRWADGATYAGRIDLEYDTFPDLGAELHRRVKFYTGDHCPWHMGPEKYAAALANVDRESAKNFLANYDTGGPHGHHSSGTGTTEAVGAHLVL